MKATHRGNPESRFDRFAFWLGFGIAAWLASMFLTQVFYWLVPAKPSLAVLRLQEEASHRPGLTENGFRLAGLLAPAGGDPVAFGKCLFPNAEAMAELPFLDMRYSPPSKEEDQVRLINCLRTQTALAIPPAIANSKVEPRSALNDWISLGNQTPPAALLDRAEAIWSEGPRYLGVDFWSPTPDPRPLSNLSQWRVAHAVSLWHSGSRSEAMKLWASSAQYALLSANGRFSETMLSSTEFSRLLLGIQTAAQGSNQIGSSESTELLKIIAVTEDMAETVRKSMVSEWHGSARGYRSWYHGMSPNTNKDDRHDQAMFGAIFEILKDFTFDPTQTVNQYTVAFEQDRDLVFQLASGLSHASKTEAPRSEWGMRAWYWLCRPYQRNILGQTLLEWSRSDYTAYGTRIADLRNLAAATRLTIEARRQGLQGEALARFVAEAPENMRDIFSKAPFAYDPGQRQLTIQLREKSTVLGEGRYTLSL